MTSSSTQKTVASGGAYETTLTPENDYKMKSVSIKMGGVELASNPSVYQPATGRVRIANVSDDIVIRAAAESKTKQLVPAKHTITVRVTGGTASPGGAVQVEDGKDQTIAFTPAAGYTLKSVTVDNAPAVLNGNRYTFANVTADHTISVVYEKGSGGSGGGGTAAGKYPVHVETDGRGTAAADKDRAAAGEVVTITAEGMVEGITATADKSGKDIGLTDKGNGKYTFHMPGSAVTVRVRFAQKQEIPHVADPDDTGVSSALDTKRHVAYMVGYATGHFGPANNITRAEVAQAFYRLLLDQSHSQNPSFPDVPADAWYRGAVQTAVSYGWIKGYQDGSFRPEQPIGRAETAAIVNRMLSRIADRSAVDNGAGTRFPDVPANHWAFYDVVEASTKHSYTRHANTDEESWII